MSSRTNRRPRVGVSACLLGERVRYDAAHKHALELVQRLAARVECIAVCPEVEAGLGVPRPPMRLERVEADVRMIEIASTRDHTERMRAYAERRVRELLALPLSGYVLKARSPSCGARAVPVYSGDAEPVAGQGLFAEALIAACPSLPVADEEELAAAERCDAFLARVIAYAADGDRNP